MGFVNNIPKFIQYLCQQLLKYSYVCCFKVLLVLQLYQVLCNTGCLCIPLTRGIRLPVPLN